jgi:hypothetical protein
MGEFFFLLVLVFEGEKKNVCQNLVHPSALYKNGTTKLEAL